MKDQRQMAQRAIHEVLYVRDDYYAKNEAGRDEFRAYCIKVPSMIQRFGLPQTIAFLQARQETFDAAQRYIAVLEKVVGRTDLLGSSINADMMNYFAQTRGTLQASAWLRRFAQAELPAPDKTQPEAEM